MATTAPPPPPPAELQADQAAARGDAATARRLLEDASRTTPERAETWLKLAAMCRASGDVNAALDAIAGALRIDPLAFVPLLMKANLLDAAGRKAEAGEAYGNALAQRPSPAPGHLSNAIAQAEARHAEHLQAAAARLAKAAAAREAELPEAEARRAARFRSNILRTTRVFHSEPTHFHYPGLAEREFHDREDFPWLGTLEAATDAIAADFERVMAAERSELVPYIQYPEDVPLRQWAALNQSKAWTAIHLLQNGERVEANARHCEATMAVLARLDQPDIARRSPNAMFSLLAPGTHIPPHVGVSNARLVCHLPLIVPEGCWFRVGAERRAWNRGEAFVFDDTIEHEAMNPSQALRVVFIIDTWHPGLSKGERAAVRAIMEASDGGEGEGI